MNEYDKYRNIKLNIQNTSINFSDSLNKTKLDQLKEISRKTKIKNNLYFDKNSNYLETELLKKRANKKLNFLPSSKTDYSMYNKVPHKKRKSSYLNNDKKINALYQERGSDAHLYNNHNSKDYKNFILDTDNSNCAKTINNSNNSKSFKKLINNEGNKHMLSKILRSKLFNNQSKTRNVKNPKIKILINEKKMNFIKTIQNNKLKKQEKDEDEFIENYLLLNDEYKKYSNYINDNTEILYVIDDEQKNIYQNIDNSKRYSDSNDYDLIINNTEKKNIDNIYLELLKLNERKWMYELDDISNLLINNREILDNNIYSKYIKEIIKLNEHFNWLVNSIVKYFNNIFFEDNPEILIQNCFDLPKIENIWFKGFKWKGLFIRVVPQDKSKFIINEVKSLNYFFLDYLQIIEGYKNFQNNKNLLSSYIIFPLISYAKINGFILYASTLINYEENYVYNNSDLTFIEDIIIENKGHIKLYSSMNNMSYYLNINPNNKEDKEKIGNNRTNKFFINYMKNRYDIKDLEESKLFSNINIYHIIKFQKEKFLLLNVSEFIPSLFKLKVDSKIDLNFISSLDNLTGEFSIKFDLKIKKIINDKSKIKNNNIINQNASELITNLLKLKSGSTLKKKDLKLCGIHFRILHQTQYINNKNYKTKDFVDFLFNYEKNNYNDKKNLNFLKYETYINKPYIILYDLTEPNKLKYSLIKNNYNLISGKIGYNKDIYDSYCTTSNYTSYLINFCKMINNNFQIKSYFNLKQIMKKFGIDTNLKYLMLFYLDNKQINDIIKIHFLVKAIGFIINKKACNNLLDKINQKTSIMHSSKSSLLNNSCKNIREEDILYSIQSILYPNEVLPINKSFVSYFYQNLVFYMKIIFLKFRLINNYLSLNNIFDFNNKYNSPKIFLKQIIKTARKKPFIFIKELQHKLNFVLNPYILFKSSLSIESMKNVLEKKYIHLNNSFNYSYINNEEISGLALIKFINYTELIDNNIINKNLTNKSIKLTEKFELDSQKKIKHLNSYNYINNESHNSTYDSRKNNILDFDNLSSLVTKINISDSLEVVPKFKEECEIIYENKFLSEALNDLLKDFIIQISPNCYKMNYIYENSEKYQLSLEKDNTNSIFNNLKPFYKVSDSKILYNWLEFNENIFNGIKSHNGNVQHTLLKTYFFRFIFSFFVEKANEKSKNILIKIKEIYSNENTYIISMNYLAIINLFEGLLNENNCELSISEKESFFSKSLMLFLMNYGDPRGRRNDSHEILLYPIWKLLTIVYEIENNSLIYDYFKEMFLSLNYLINDKYKLDLESVKDIQTDKKFKNTEYYLSNYKYKRNMNLVMNYNQEITKDSLNFQYSNKNNRNIDKANNNDINHLYYLSDDIFNNEAIYEESWKFFSFPLINEQNSKDISKINNNCEKQIFSKDFISYFMNIVKNILVYENEVLLDKNYIIENIGSDVLMEISPPKKETIKNNRNLSSLKKSSSQQKITVEKKGINSEEKKYKNMKKNKSEIFIKNTKSSLYNNFSHFLYKELLQKLSYKLNSPSGVIISFGNNSHHETGLDEKRSITSPHIVYKLKNKTIKHIYAGWEHNIVITRSGKVYSFGHNQFLQCGYPNIKGAESIKNPKNISKINNDIRAISASCGNEHSLILSNEHIVYSFGNNEDGILGINLNLANINSKEKKLLNTYKLNKVDFGEYTNKIIEISSGTAHNLALTYDGKIFSWGSCQGGQLGLSLEELESFPEFKNNFFINSPINIPFSDNPDVNIVKICCGEAHSIALTNEGNVYSWGFGSNGQLGLGFCEDSFEPGEGLKNSIIYKPQIIKSLYKEKICDIKCGKTFSMFIDEKGELYASGVNDLNQLGIQDNPSKEHLYDKEEATCFDFVFPIKVDYFLNMKVENISCGEGHCLAVITDILSNTQTVWSWGNNKFGQLGQNIILKKCFPRPINCLFEYNLYKFNEVACGGFHSLCLINHYKDTNWIEDDYDKFICSLIDDMGIS